MFAAGRHGSVAAFEYKALTPEGRRTSGVISADTARAARRELRARKLTPVSLTETRGEKAGSFGGGKLREKDRTVLTRQLSVLLLSGMTVEQALTAAAGDGGNAALRSLLFGVRARVMEGTSLADAMRASPRAFPPLYRSVVAAGEASGRIGAVLDQLASHLERSYRLKTLIRSAMIYPAILGITAILMVSALMVWVVPKLVEQFVLLGASELPPLTQAVIALSEFFRSWGIVVLILCAVAGLILNRALKAEHIRRRWDGLVLRLPYIGDLNRKIAAARFARIHATLSASGATIIESLAGARNAMGNLVFRDAASHIMETVQRGGSLSGAMKATGVFPPLMTHMVASGEIARDVPAMMNRAADFLESEFETSTNVALSLLEPLIIILLGGIVGTIVLSIMLPIMQLNTIALG
ncbi:MAG: type II secretion system F family protein [Hyphomonas sp.]